MSRGERRRTRALTAYFQPSLPDRVDRFLFDHGRPGRASIGDLAADRLHELLVMAGARLLVLTLFVDFVTGEFLPLTAFNLALALPVAALWFRSWYDGGHGLGNSSLLGRLQTWHRRRRRDDLHTTDDRL